MFLSGRISGKNKKATGDNLVVGIVHDGYPCRLAREVATRKGQAKQRLVSLDCVINWVTVMTGACLCSVFVYLDNTMTKCICQAWLLVKKLLPPTFILLIFQLLLEYFIFIFFLSNAVFEVLYFFCFVAYGVEYSGQLTIFCG